MSFQEILEGFQTRMASGPLRRVGGTQLGAWAIKHVVTPLLRWLYRRTGGNRLSTGHFVGPILLLTTTGRRTGKEHTTPLLYLRDGQRLVICNVNPGFERPNPWTLNLRAHPVVPVQVGREIGTYRAREATEEEVRRYWPQIWPAYQTHYDKSGQRSLFVLEPVPTAGEQLLS